jgi:hypothetical protein
VIWLELVYFPHALRADLLSDDDWQRVERELLANPRAGAVIAGTGGARKLRVRVQGRGKRGGARTIYLYVEVNERIYFLATYAKNEAADLTPDDKAAIRRLIDVLRQEKR